MKKILVAVLVVAIALLGASAAMANGIATTKHNLTSTGTTSQVSIGQNVAQICIYCHTPHESSTNGFQIAGGVPLWNKAGTTTYSTTGAYTLYASTGPSGTIAAYVAGDSNQPGTVSAACLSCHDGTTSINVLNNVNESAANPAGTGAIPAGIFQIAKGAGRNDISSTHPIGFNYANAWRYSQFNTAAGNIVNGLPLPGGMVECNSCHDVHDSAAVKAGNTNGTVANGYFPLLKDSIIDSKLCLDCHNK